MTTNTQGVGIKTKTTTKKLGALMACAFGMTGTTMAQQAQASFTFTKIAATGTVNPSGGTFGLFDDPAISGLNVAFHVYFTDNTEAIYVAQYTP